MSTALQTGIFVLGSLPPWRTSAEVVENALDQIKLADELGFDHAWVAEHNARTYGVISSTQVLLAAAAAQTERIRLGSAATRLPLHHPLRVAEDFALLDNISKGRISCALGKAYSDTEFQSYGLSPADRETRFAEGVEIVSQALHDGEVEFYGEHFQVPGDKAGPVTVFPSTVQQPQVPIYLVIAQSNASVIEAARKGWSFILGRMNDTESVAAKVALYRQESLAAGFNEASVEAAIARSSQLRFINCAPTRAEAVESYREGLTWYLADPNSRVAQGFGRTDLPYQDYINQSGVIVGSPDDVIADLKGFKEATGLGGILGWFDVGGRPNDDVRAAMTLFAREVVPNL